MDAISSSWHSPTSVAATGIPLPNGQTNRAPDVSAPAPGERVYSGIARSVVFTSAQASRSTVPR